MTDAAVNRAGTEPPDGCVTPAGGAVTGARDGGGDTGGDETADGEETADGDETADRAADGAADGVRAVPHPAASATISRPPHAAANDLFTELAS